MGERVRKSIKKDSGNPNETTGTAIGFSDSNTSAGSEGTGNNTGTGTGNNTGTGTTQAEKELPKLVSIDVPNSTLTDEEKKARRNAKDRERYQQRKAEKGNSKNSKPNVIDKNQLNIIIATVSGIIASRPNMEVWMLSETEINQLTNPLSNIMAKSDTLSGMGEYADHIALLIACSTIVIPRIILTLDKHREVKKNVTNKSINNATESVKPEPNKTGTNKRNDSGNVRNFTDKHQNDSTDLYELIPSIS